MLKFIERILRSKLSVLILLQTFVFCSSPPKGRSGERANTLLKKLYESTNIDSWEKTNAVSFVWEGNAKRAYFWDKKRGLIETKWEDTHVQFFHKGLKGIVYQTGKLLEDSQKIRATIHQAYEYFVNDTFWLNPVFHLDSPGAEKKYVSKNQLLVYYSKGGVTPGDSYLFTLDQNFLIENMKMWVSILPIKGISVDFTNYIETETGVKLALDHEMLFLNIRIQNVRMYENYPVKTKEDVFSRLLN